ncbi:hypothetical protein D3C76_1826190 [compost metagenome]
MVATLAAVAKKVAIGAGAPAYTSGVHLWNGASDNLNATAKIMSAKPNNTIGCLIAPNNACTES